VLGVALFGSLLGGAGAFVTGVRLSLIISVALLFGVAATIMLGSYKAPQGA
jgi:MFS transporter, DHA2 family, methylenomycin A resistance protein